MRRGAGACPSCGEPVSPFAAGCAICGADLERHRARQAASAGWMRRVSPSSWLATERGKTTALLAVLVLTLIVSPLLCLLLAIVVIYDRNRTGDTAVRNAAIAIAVVNVGLLLVPDVRFGLLSLLL